MKALKFIGALLCMAFGIASLAFGVMTLLDFHDFAAGKFNPDGINSISAVLCVLIGLAAGVQGLAMLPDAPSKSDGH